ncbi:MAG: type II toxin-antitoxin system VapC family toxin [Gemmatimonas sp.]
MMTALSAAPVRFVAAPALVEASAVLYARKGAGGDRLSLVTIDMNAVAAAFARDAFRRFGKDVGNPGVLNYGDCLVYGVAMASGQPLLFKGDDFARTDILAVQY